MIEKLNVVKDTTGTNGIDDLANEILVMKKTDKCHNVVHLKEIYEDDLKLYLVMEYC